MSRSKHHKPRNRYMQYRRNASARGYTWWLSEERFTKLIQQPCHYCGAKPDPINGIDRMNNSLGYHWKNVVPCCSDCNYFKGRLDYDEFITRAKRIAEHMSQDERGTTADATI